MSVSAVLADRLLMLTIDNPPVNALSVVERQGIIDGIARADAPDVDAVILIGAGHSFIAGADIREFGLPPIAPHLPEVVAAIEACARPVVAALAGSALGGGLEIALAAHYRIAAPDAKLGLPEVTLGLVPGAGGTQRLPRLIDPLAAAKLITSGKPVTAREAFRLGLVDRIADGSILDDARALAKACVGHPLSERRLSNRRPVATDATIEQLDQLRAKLKKASRGAQAPLQALDLVTAALTESYEAGMALERASFLDRRASDEAAALRHIFFAEREAVKAAGGEARPIAGVGVIGAGTMGAGIAMNIADAGLPVILVDQTEEALAAGLARIDAGYADAAAKGRITAEEGARRRSRVTAATDYAALADSDLIIEAAFETMAVKESIFRRLDAIAKPGAILATNTSYLDLDLIAAVTARPADVVGLHYFSPANVMKLMEIVRGRATSPSTLATAIAFARRTAKLPVVAGVCHGFIGNRMLRAYNREAGLLLIEGASPAQVDAALTGFGMAMGPFAVADMSGIDIGHKGRQVLPPGSYEPAAFEVHDQLVARDMLGRKSGRGFYVYEGGKAIGPNDAVAPLIDAARAARGISPRAISDEEIVERCLYAAATEGLAIVAEGIAARPGDIDVVFVNGYGFPRHRGGPVHMLDRAGEQAKAALEQFRSGPFGHCWTAAGIT